MCTTIVSCLINISQEEELEETEEVEIEEIEEGELKRGRRSVGGGKWRKQLSAEQEEESQHEPEQSIKLVRKKNQQLLTTQERKHQKKFEKATYCQFYGHSSGQS